MGRYPELYGKWTEDHFVWVGDGGYYIKVGADYEIWSPVIIKAIFEKIDEDKGAIGLSSINDGDIPLPFYLPQLYSIISAINFKKPTHRYPQFVVEPGYYRLFANIDTVTLIDNDIISSYNLLVNVKPRVTQSIVVTPSRYSQLQPNHVFVLAKSPFASVEIVNYIVNPESKLIEIDLSPTPHWNYYLAIVLSDTFNIVNAVGYASPESVVLSLNFDYTSFDVAGYRIYSIRLTPEIDHLTVKYGVYGDLTLKPEVLNLKSQGRWVTGYIEVLPPYTANDIDHTTVELCFGDLSVEAEGPWSIGDYDNDDITDLMVKFNGSAVKEMLLAKNIVPPLDVEFLARGAFTDSVGFAARGMIHVISQGGGPQSSEGKRTASVTFGIYAVNPSLSSKSVKITYGINIDGIISLKLYDASGRLIRKLVNELKPCGMHYIIWNGKDELGRECPAGIYFVELKSQGTSDVAKVILVR